MKYILIFFLLCGSVVQAANTQTTGKVREYQLTIDYAEVPVEGAAGIGMLVNGQYPGPVLYFDEGEIARITVKNNMEVNTSIHWHGLLLPYDQDGVPWLSNLPIFPKGTFTYEFPIIHNGTYWYHSHVGLQEQQGVHGGIVIFPKKQTHATDYDTVLVLQDWTREDPEKVLANLKKDGEYYAMKKDAVVSLWGYWQQGLLKNWWQARWTRMGAMDLSDIGYDAFLINGKREQTLFENAKAGEKIRLRIINSGASTYFYIHTAEGLDWQVIAADGMNVQPFSPKEIFQSPAETYDLLVTVPHHGAYEVRASTQDGTGYASVFIGSGNKYYAEKKPKPNLFLSHDEHAGHGDHSQAVGNDAVDHAAHGAAVIVDDPHAHHKMDAKPVSELGASNKPDWSYRLLKSVEDSRLPAGEVRDVVLRLTGNMTTYNWSFNDVPLFASDKIVIKRGEVVRFHFINETMMDHPLHLHGHFFRVLTGNGAYEPLKHTVNVAPFAKVTIEFYANEENDWFFHCHNLYHHRAGMARVISYQDGDEDSDENSDEDNHIGHDFMKHHGKDEFFYAGELKLLNDFARFDFSYFNSQHRLSFELRSYDYEAEVAELEYDYVLSDWLRVLLAAEADKENEEVKIGFSYVLPLLIDMHLYWKDDNKFEAALATEIQLSKHIQAHLEYSSSNVYHYGLEYRFNAHWSAEVSMTDVVGASAGINLRF